MFTNIYTYKGKTYYSLNELLDSNELKISFDLLNNKVLPPILNKLGIKIQTKDLSQSEINERIDFIKKIRNRYLKETDKYMLRDFPIEQLRLDSIIAYRHYLRDYTLKENWWLEKPKILKDFLNFDQSLYERLK